MLNNGSCGCVEYGARKNTWFSSCFLALVLILASVGCAQKDAPRDFVDAGRIPEIYPDYRNVTVPPNIAPMNFDVTEEDIDDALTVLSCEGKRLATYSGWQVRFPKKFWKKTLQENLDKALVFTVYVKKDGKWTRFDDWTMNVSADKIDPWISYRKIFPGYEYFSDLALWNRDLESFKERDFFRARLVNERTCVNCHSFQNYGSNAFMFHMRITEPGTVFCVDGNIVKRDLKADGMIAGCSYPAWPPNSLHVAFASCETMQVFRTKSLDRLDVLDAYSDLYLHDVAQNKVRPVLPPSDDSFDTYPHWSSDGKTLYYCSSKNPGTKTKRTDPNRRSEILQLREGFKYDVKKVTYDETTGRFGKPEMVFEASALDKSALFPRVSPDGKTLLVTMTRFGCFPIWYLDADIWIVDLTTGEARPLDEINCPGESDSYHSWTSTGKWIVFASRRDDGTFTRLYFSHYDGNGKFSKPFMLPQKDPGQTIIDMFSYNVPEFTLEPVKVPKRAILKEAAVSNPEKAILVN